MAVWKCFCRCSKYRDILDIPKLKEILPVDYEYNVCTFKEEDDHFVSKFRINIESKSSALLWLKEFYASSCSEFKKSKTFPEDTKGNVYKVYMNCRRNTQPRSSVKKPHVKHTGCRAILSLTVKKKKTGLPHKSTDIHMQDFPTVVVLHHMHNHVLKSADALKYREPSTEVKDTFLKLFQAGYSPSKAFHYYNAELQELYEDKYYVIAADRAISPDIKWVYYNYQVFRKEYGETSETGIECTMTPLPSDPTNRKSLLFIATGTEDVTDDWFSSLTEDNQNSSNNASFSKEHTKSSYIPKSTEASQYKDNLNQINAVFADISDRIKNSEPLLKAAGKFVKNYINAKTENGLESALSTFALYSGFKQSTKKKYATLSTIGVQPTALARRKVPCGGRLSLQSGRPPKSSYVHEHGYSEPEKSTLLPRKKPRMATPHDIAFCSGNNISLGKTH